MYQNFMNKIVGNKFFTEVFFDKLNNIINGGTRGTTPNYISVNQRETIRRIVTPTRKI